MVRPSVEDTIKRWVRHDGCSAEPQVEPTQHGVTKGLDTAHTATKIVYGEYRDGMEVVLWKLIDAGHVLPGLSPNTLDACQARRRSGPTMRRRLPRALGLSTKEAETPKTAPLRLAILLCRTLQVFGRASCGQCLEVRTLPFSCLL